MSSQKSSDSGAPSARATQERAGAWQRLQELSERALRGGLRRLPSQEVLELGRLYRRAASDLSRSRALGLDPREVALLNGLVGRAYGLIYTPERGGAASAIAFFTQEFPRCLRRNFAFLAASVLISLVGAVIGWAAALANRDAMDLLMGSGWSQAIDNVGRRHQRGHDWMPARDRPLESAGIMTNNIRVSFFAFAGGILLGLLTLWVLFNNGVMLGAVAIAAARHGTALELWGFVGPHGVIELPAIFIAGAAGLMLGYALVNPGEYTRRTAVSMAGREAILLVIGVVAMLVIAGIIEAFFSPMLLPPFLKLTVAAFTFAGEVAYFALAGRESGVQDSSPEHPNIRTPEYLNPAIRPLPPL